MSGSTQSIARREILEPGDPLARIAFPSRNFEPVDCNQSPRRGGFAEVIECKDDCLGRVALKVFYNDADDSEQSIELLRRELIPRRIPAHPNIGWVWGVGVTEGGKMYSVQEFYQHTCQDLYLNMAPEMRQIGSMIDIAVQLCDALQHLEIYGVVHGDITPKNIVFDEFFRPKLIDWGLSMFVGPGNSAHALGTTPLYASPELLMSDLISHSSDLYAFGATLYSLLWRDLPWPSRGMGLRDLRNWHQRRGNDPISIPESCFGDPLPKQIRDVLSAVLDPDPNKRPSSALVIKRALLPFAKHPNCCEPLPNISSSAS